MHNIIPTIFPSLFQSRAYDKYFGRAFNRSATGDSEQGDDFVAENLLRMDVYYDNLDEKHITEAKKYDVRL